MSNEEDLQNDQSVTTQGEEEPREDTLASEEPEEQSEDTSDTPEPTDDGDETESKTDRGTKVAKEPESRFYQQLKNENADMRRILNEPGSLKEYLRQIEGTPVPEKGKEDDLADLAEKTIDPATGQVDLVKLTKYMDERTQKQIEQGMTHLSSNFEKRNQMQRAYDEEKASVRGEHPELDPRQKDRFDQELDEFIGERFVAQGGLEGKVSLKQVVDSTFAFLTKQRSLGKAQAETDVVRKRVGAIPRSSNQGDSQKSEEQMTPEEMLVTRIRKQLSGK